MAFLEVSVRLITPVCCRLWAPAEADDSSQMGACEDAVSATYLHSLPWGHCVHWDTFHCSDPRKSHLLAVVVEESRVQLASDVGVWDLVPLISQLLLTLTPMYWLPSPALLMQSPPSLLPSSITSNKREVSLL